MVIIGNPPYSYESENKGHWIVNLLKDYYKFDNKPLGERNPKGLQDDYVKFIRFSQWRIEQTGYGILSFITNHNYIDNPTFRGMRQNLRQAFDDIYILDLHGSVLKKEKCPDGSKDENVFDIQRGVAISTFVKRESEKKQKNIVDFAEIFGKRGKLTDINSGKYGWLNSNDISLTKWKRIRLDKNNYNFTFVKPLYKAEYESYISINDAMPINSVGLYSARDNLAIQDSKVQLEKLLREFRSLEPEEARSKFDLGKDSRDWKVEFAQDDVRSSKIVKNNIYMISYRPFSNKWTYYTGKSRGFICMPRREVMHNMLHNDNISLCFLRRSRLNVTTNFFVAKFLIDKSIISSADNAYVAPLYLINENHDDLFRKTESSSTTVNFSQEFIDNLSRLLRIKFTKAESYKNADRFNHLDIFYYIYSIFYSPSYRTRYAEFLKRDFPRIPLTSNKTLFRSLCKLGEQLVGLHLMDTFGPDITSYRIDGDHLVEKVRYTEPGQGAKHGRVWINKTQYFEGVTPEVWQFMIGGYQVCEKWLKDRKRRNLTDDDIVHYQRLVSALSETIKIMAEIDAVIENHGGWPLK
jgi:predicted helicase